MTSEMHLYKNKRGFTLLETIIACGIMVVAFAMLAVIFGKAYDINREH